MIQKGVVVIIIRPHCMHSTNATYCHRCRM